MYNNNVHIFVLSLGYINKFYYYYYSILSGLHDVQGTCSLGFSSSGKLLVSVGLDEKYTIGVWRWKEGSLVAR
jgi:hypothetical protein